MVRALSVGDKVNALLQKVAYLPVPASSRAQVAQTVERLDDKLPEALREHLLDSSIGQAVVGSCDFDAASDQPIEQVSAERLDAIYAAVADEIKPRRKLLADKQKKLGKLESERDKYLFIKKGWFSRPTERHTSTLSAQERTELLDVNQSIAEVGRQIKEVSEELEAFGAVGQVATAIRGESFFERGEVAMQVSLSRPWFPLPLAALIPQIFVQVRMPQRDRETGIHRPAVDGGAMLIGGYSMVQGMARFTSKGVGYGAQPGITIGPFSFGAYAGDDALMGKTTGAGAWWPGGGFYAGAYSRPESVGGASGFEGGTQFPLPYGATFGIGFMVGHQALRRIAEPVVNGGAKSLGWVSKPFVGAWQKVRDLIDKISESAYDRHHAGTANAEP